MFPFKTLLKTPEDLGCSGVFRGYKVRKFAKNGQNYELYTKTDDLSKTFA